MKETSQTIATVKRDVQLSEWQRQIQERQEQGVTVDEWCISLGISKGTYYHRLRKVREYMRQRIGVMEAGASEETSQSAVVPIRVAQQKEAHARRKFAEALPIYSLAATATANGLNVEEYLTRLCRSETILPWV